ncbi:PCMD domain-containing protein, partial [Barnesiella intestinihominis]
PSDRKLFDKNDPHIIAYADMYSGKSVTEYTPFTLELEYRDTDRIPTYIVVVASASKYGDYFTGGDGSVLFLDDFTLEYDY